MKPNRRVKKSDSPSKLVLEEIIGLTTKNANGLASSESTPLSAYIAGCVVVLHDANSGQQSRLLAPHRTPKPLSCVAMSLDGRLVAAGESGNQPAVLVWERLTGSFLSDLSGHVCGVECIAFSPDGERLVSVGGYINLWDWKKGVLVAKLKASSSAISSVSFTANGKFIVTAGKKHLKFWTVGLTPKKSTRLSTVSVAGAAPMIQGKPVNLGPHKGSSFVCVTSSANAEPIGSTMFSIYALTVEGVLCVIDNGLSVVRSAELKVEKGLALSASRRLIACACCSGIVRLFTSETLTYAGSLLHSKPKVFDEPSDDQTEVIGDESIPSSPDAVACQFSASEKLVVIYADHSLYIWDVLDVSKATRCWMLVSHSACIWDIKNLCCENMHDPSLGCAARGCLAGVSFATCSADGTIRLWDLEPQPQFVGDDDSELHAPNEPISTSCVVSTGIFERDTLGMGVSSQGLRSMAVSSDGKYLAAGDSEGSLHIYNLCTSQYTCVQDIHQAEILSLSFSVPHEEHVNRQEDDLGNYLLVSGGRDRVIHLYDVKRNFDLIASVDDHSAAVTCVKLDREGCKAISCSADRSLVFRDVFLSDTGCKIFRRHHQMASNGTVYDMAVDPKMEFVVTVGQDKKINTFDAASGKLVRSFKQDKDFGDPIKVIMDPSCSYLVCSYSNKSICVYDSMTGEMVTQAMGHGEIVTGVVFLPDCKHLVSVAGDGCIFVWKLPPRMSYRILHKMKEIYPPLSPRKFELPLPSTRIMLHEEDSLTFRVDAEDKQDVFCEGVAHERTPTFRFSISRLPKWAQSRLADSSSIQINPICSPSQSNQEQVELKFSPPLTRDGQESDHLYLEVQSPLPSLDICSTKSCLSSSSSDSARTTERGIEPVPRKSLSQFVMDKRWLSVYTVCHILNSPELQRSMDLNMPVSSSSSEKDKALIDGARSQSQAREGITEESAIFKQHFGSLSTATKIEGSKSKSSVRRSYSARYVVRRDNPALSQKLFATPFRDSGRNTCQDIEDDGTHIHSENPLIKCPKGNLVFHNRSQSLAQDDSTNCITEEEASDMTRESSSEESDVLLQERVSLCIEALLKLDTAAENALHLFANGPEAEFHNGASDLLSSITKKIDAVAKLVHRGK
ncbi:unnamed protein product [Linum trigynum]|uniref:Mitogen-activated protein kinase-binding protein 1 n=1 Tax=Linum trigynum TaxID=586398 RepID=A0AAV2DYW9_9ROSI